MRAPAWAGPAQGQDAGDAGRSARCRALRGIPRMKGLGLPVRAAGRSGAQAAQGAAFETGPQKAEAANPKVRRGAGALRQLDLYVHPGAQGEGIGSWVLEQVLSEADAEHQPVSVTALKHSEANRFYQRHGFELQAESEWDMHYLRAAR